MINPVKQAIQRLLASVGITINGPAPGDIQVRDKRFYGRVFTQGSLGLGESYMDGWWECQAIDVFITRLLSRPLPRWACSAWPVRLRRMIGRITNFPRWKSFYIGQRHYDLGNNFYQAMLGPTLAYSCAYWKDASSLEQAQQAKLDLVCRKLGLRQGQQILDIGCGWGSFARHAAEHYGARVVGITVSRDQERLAREQCRGFPIEIRYQDYREIQGTFDHIVSIGMFEHVGYKNYRTYLQIANRSLADNGLFLLHTIGSQWTTTDTDPWIAKYIFPHSKLPSLKQISEAIEGLFLVEDLENFGADYDKTLLAWYQNFEAHWPRFRSSYGERFYRMWRYYLLMSAGAFRSRQNQVWQIVLSKRGVPGGYRRGA